MPARLLPEKSTVNLFHELILALLDFRLVFFLHNSHPTTLATHILGVSNIQASWISLFWRTGESLGIALCTVNPWGRVNII